MRESVDREFAVFVDARQDRWLRGAYLVCADVATATAAVRYAFARLSLRWGREDDPDAYALRILYERLCRWRLPGRATPRRTEAVDGVVAALGELKPRQRAMLVLSYFEELTVVETGDLLELSHLAVRQQLQVAVSRFQAVLGATSVRPQDLRVLLDQAVDRVLSPTLADDAWAAGTAIGRRRRRAGLAVAATVVLVVVVGALLTGISEWSALRR